MPEMGSEGNQDSLLAVEEMRETECPVKPGQVPHNVDKIQRTEIHKGYQSTTISKRSTKGLMNKIEVLGQPMFGTRESIGEHTSEQE